MKYQEKDKSTEIESKLVVAKRRKGWGEDCLKNLELLLVTFNENGF